MSSESVKQTVCVCPPSFLRNVDDFNFTHAHEKKENENIKMESKTLNKTVFFFY